MKRPGSSFFRSLRNDRFNVRRDLDPRSPYWLSTGGIFGLILWYAAAPPWALGHTLLHERGAIQPFSMVLGGMVAGFIFSKQLMLLKESRRESKTSLPAFPAHPSDSSTIRGIEEDLERKKGILARRFQELLRVWTATGSAQKVEAALENDTEAYDLAQQSSYALPRILVWSIPVLGFLGTVMGIGESVSGFQSFLSKADDIDVLREGLVNVTSGLGTAFDTTFLALLISVVVVFPLTLTERLEQRMLTKVDLQLKKSVLEGLPETSSGNSIDKSTIDASINHAFEKFLPTPEALVEPAKAYATRAAELILEQLSPLKSMSDEAISCLQEARASTKDQTNEISTQLRGISEDIRSSIDSLSPVLTTMQTMASSSEELRHELENLRSGDQLNKTFQGMQSTMDKLGDVLRESQRPKKVVLVEQVIE